MEERTELALLFLEEVEERGYVGMFYASSSDIEYDVNWVTSEIESKYRVWVAQYKSDPITPGAAEGVVLSAEIGVNFQETSEEVTPKEEVNVRSTMDQSSKFIYTSGIELRFRDVNSVVINLKGHIIIK